MPRWKHLRGWEERVASMTPGPLDAEIEYWRMRLGVLGARAARKAVANRIRALERIRDAARDPAP